MWCRDEDWQNTGGRALPAQQCSQFRLLEGLLGTAGWGKGGDNGEQDGESTGQGGAGVGVGGAWTALPIRPLSQHRNPWDAQH